MKSFKIAPFKTLALTAVMTAILGTSAAHAERPMRGVPIKKKAPKVLNLKKLAKAKIKTSSWNKKIGNSIMSSGVETNAVELPQSCRFIPFSSGAPLWIPTMYIEPSEEFKGVYLPLVSEGMIATDPAASADAKRVWPNTNKNWMAVAEADYSSLVFDLESAEGISERNLILGLHEKVINRTQKQYSADKKARNYISSSVLTKEENNLLQTVYNRFSETSWANDYNKSLCDRYVKTGELNQGVIMRAKELVSVPRGQKADALYAVTSSSLYMISDVYNSNGQDGIVSYERKRSFVISYLREGAETTHVFGCNICADGVKDSPDLGNGFITKNIEFSQVK